MRAMNEIAHHLSCSFDTVNKCFTINGASMPFTVRDVSLILGMNFFFTFCCNLVLIA
jgi:hypothetical protein